MNIAILCGDNYNQITLANKIAEEFNVVGIVVEEKRKRKIKKTNLKTAVNILLDRIIFSSLGNSWKELQNYYKNKYSNYPKTKLIKVKNVNDEEVLNFLKNINPDILIISGTRIIKSPILNLPVKLGILNLHTGLSPYVKGGPNCTNWCIAKNEFHLIGNTIMWLDPGIDSGNIIAAETTDLKKNESLLEIHIKVMDHAHDLYLRSLRKVQDDRENVKSIPQNLIGTGKTYFNRDWNYKEKKALLRNFKKFKFSNLKYPEVKTVQL
jgi:methionyl-tRNA formyltransferase